jgi:hypothetical protein
MFLFPIVKFHCTQLPHIKSPSHPLLEMDDVRQGAVAHRDSISVSGDIAQRVMMYFV